MSRRMWTVLVAILVAVPSWARAEEDSGRVTRVVNASSIVVKTGRGKQKVALIGIESLGERTSDTREFMEGLVLDRTVILRSEPGWPDRDPLGLLLRYVYLEDETLVNAEVLKAGMATALAQRPFSRLEEFAACEKSARDAKVGFWKSGAFISMTPDEIDQLIQVRAQKGRAEDGRLYAGAEGVSNPKLIAQTPHEYPQRALFMGKQAQIVLDAIIGKDGTVEEATVVNESTPHYRFGKAAIAWVREWRYQPATWNGEPVEVHLIVVVDFVLK